MALDLTTRKAATPSAQPQRVALSTFVRNKLSQTMNGKKLDDFCTAVVSLVNNNPMLARCDQTSLIASCLQAQSLNMSLNQGIGHAYIVPYGDKATFILGYKGYIQLAIRSGQYKKLNVLAIKAGELLSWDPLNEEIEISLIADEKVREKAETIGYYAMFEYINGFRKALYWSKDKMEEHAKRYSPLYAKDLRSKGQSSFWSKDFDAMAIKTMLRQLISKWGIMSIEMQQAIINDGKVADGEYIDGTVLDTEYQQTPVVEPEVVNENTGEVVEEKPKAKKGKAGSDETATAIEPTVDCPERDNIPTSVRFCNEKCDKRQGCQMWED